MDTLGRLCVFICLTACATFRTTFGATDDSNGTTTNGTWKIVPPPDEQEATQAALEKERVAWFVGCTMFTILVFGFATYQYLRKRARSPKNKKRLRAKEAKNKQEREERLVQAVTFLAVRRDEFLATYGHKKKKKTIYFEYVALCRNHETHAHEVAMRPENKVRVKDPTVCMPYDYNRVVLQPWQGLLNNFYNASYVDGYAIPNQYIAAEGPQMETVMDFWRMVWQERVQCVVMATSLYQHARMQCIRYWPKAASVLGPLLIRSLHVEELASFSIRTFGITHEQTGEVRTLRQFQILDWSEHDCPPPAVLLEFRRRIRKFTDVNPGPLLVHDSHGAGRTGTYIVLDLALERLMATGEVALMPMVQHARNARPNLMRSYEQYGFLYECISHFLQCGETAVSGNFIDSHMNSLSLKDPITKMTGYQQEFKTLNHVVQRLSVGDCAAGHRQENRDKSRDIMLQPSENARPYLTTFDPLPTATDFINAVSVSSYRKSNAFIVTQWPLKETIRDFWRLVIDHSISCVVILCKVKISKNYPMFWPAVPEREMTYGPVKVKCEKEEMIYPDFTFQDFTYSRRPTHHYKQPLSELGKASLGMHINTKEEETTLPLRIYQVTSWEHRSKPPDPGVISSVIYEADRYTKLHGSSPIVVVSKDGSGRCGVFCTVAVACEQLRAEGEVDIFNAAHLVRQNRPQMLNTLNEYTQCYEELARFAQTTDWEGAST